MTAKPQRSVSVEVEQANAMTFVADVLVLKYAQSHYGLDKMVSYRLADAGVAESKSAPPVGKHSLIDTDQLFGVGSVLFVGVKGIYDFKYGEIRTFACNALEILSAEKSAVQHVCMTLHGTGYGLDENEAFEAEIAGIIDAVTGGRAPKTLERVTIVDRDEKRVARMRSALRRLLPRGVLEVDITRYLDELASDAAEDFRSVGYASEAKPHIFVAMPFRDDMDDLYHYGILNAVKQSGYLCERADLSAYTGDVMSWVKKRIRSASLVIADLSYANPNVYLEVGYAWGLNVPTVLIVQDADDLKFDVSGQRCLTYTKIMDLEEALSKELQSLPVTPARA